jgi:hypothetical protein
MSCGRWQAGRSFGADGGPSVETMIDWATDPAVAAAHFAHRLAVETDVSD